MLKEALAAVRKDPSHLPEQNFIRVLREYAMRAASRYRQIPIEQREEKVQDKLLSLQSYLRAGKVQPGKEEAFVVTVVGNAMRDLLRRKKARGEEALDPERTGNDVPFDATDPDGGAAPRHQDLGILSRYMSLISQVSSKDQREVLEWLYEREESLQALVEFKVGHELLEGRLDATNAPALAAARKLLRARIDKHAQRGRDALIGCIIRANAHIVRNAPTELRDTMVAVYVERRSPASLIHDTSDPQQALLEVHSKLERGRAWFRNELVSSHDEGL